ncbi:MAG: Brp/Blh family beta-carotene 15,15'-dioxygenase [Candidatus Nanopelagicaceae bacterium]
MNGAKAVFSGVRNFSTLAAVFAILFSGILYLTVRNESLGWQVALAVFALAIGIPHGAVDHLVALPKTSKPKLALLIIGYVLIAIAAVFAILHWNKLGFQIVLVMSALHFGFGDAAFIAEQDRLENRPRMRPKVQNMFAITSGVIPVFIPLLKDSTKSALQEINPVLITWASEIAPQIKFLIGFFFVATLVLLVKDNRTREFIDLIFLVGLAIVAPPLISFAVYFGCWHAMRHTARLTLILPKAIAAADDEKPKKSFFAAVVPGLPALIGTVVVAAVIAITDSNLDASYLWYLLVVVWALTVPHMIVTSKIDQKSLA